MKRFIGLWAICALIFSVSCGDALNDAGKDQSGDPGGTEDQITITDDNAKYVYLQKLYNDSFSQEAYAAATSGIQSWDTDGSSYKAASRNPSRVISKDTSFYDVIETRVNDILSSNAVKAADPNYAATGGMWWNRSNITADSLVHTLKSDTGRSVIQTTIDSMKVKSAITNPITYAEDLGKDLFEPLSDMFGWGDEGDKSIDYTPYFQKICDHLGLITDKLNTMQSNIATLIGISYTTLMRTDEEKFVDAMTFYTALTTDLKAKGHADKLSTIKTYLVDSSDYDEHLIAAFKAAKQRTADLKAGYSGGTPISQVAPFNVFLSDIIFLHQMSKTRMDLVSMVMKGKDLLNYRGVKAKSDLAMVQEMNNSVWIAMQSMNANNRTQCIDAYAFLVAWEVVLRAHLAAASVNTEVVPANDVAAKHVNNGYGTFGTLGSYGNILVRDNGKSLVSPADMVNGNNLSSLFDTYNSGSIAKGKYARITVNGTNILNMGLTPVFRYFTSDYDSPEANQVYVDPVNGTYALPKPGLWCRFENNSIPTIGVITSDGVLEYQNTSVSESFGCCARLGCPSGHWKEQNIAIAKGSIFGDRGSLSLSIRMSNDGRSSNSTISLFGSDTSSVQFEISNIDEVGPLRGVLSIGGVIISTVYFGSSDEWVHIYAVWDTSGGVNGGKTISIYANGTCICSTSKPFTMPDINIKYNVSIAFNKYGEKVVLIGSSIVAIDNLKIWNHVVSENTAWINALGTNEDALHPIYGSANGYKPNTVNVSYYRNSVLGTE